MLHRINGNRVLAVSFSALAATLLVGCDSSSSSGSDSDSGSLSLSVTDAPIDGADNVFVEFTAVEFKPADGSSITFTFDEAKSIDLLAQQGGNSAPLITDEDVPAGDYNWVRLAVNAEHDTVMDSYIVIGGDEHELEVPSGSQSGLKLNSGFTVPEGGSASFTIDFDLRHSIVEANGEYKLKPVLRLIDNSGAATITGSIDSSTVIASKCDDASLFAGAVYIFTGHDIAPDDIDENSPNPIATAAVKLNEGATAYEYTAAFLSAGDYTVTYTCDSDEADVDETLEFEEAVNVTLTEGETETVDFQ